jgi:hypothetical protein
MNHATKLHLNINRKYVHFYWELIVCRLTSRGQYVVRVYHKHVILQTLNQRVRNHQGGVGIYILREVCFARIAITVIKT